MIAMKRCLQNGMAAAMTCFCAHLGCAFASEPANNLSADQALKSLMDGNARFVAAKTAQPSGANALKRRAELVNGQKPFAIVVSCSDSRVPPELIFDQGLGDIFVIRTAGEVVDAVAMGSIEYAVEHLGSPLIVVLGHENCGAVAAAVSHANEPGHIADVLKAIQPAVEETKGKPGDPVDNAIRAQALDVVKQLQSTGPIIAKSVQSGKVTIVGARYDLHTGKVELLKPRHSVTSSKAMMNR
jgi:carbonic anhydrase